MNTISIDGKKIIINGIASEFEDEIYEMVDFDHSVAVLTRPKKGPVKNNSIFGVIDGKIAWTVQDMFEYDSFYLNFPYNSYTGIYPYDKNPTLLGATSFQGFLFQIDPMTGRIVSDIGWVK